MPNRDGERSEKLRLGRTLVVTSIPGGLVAVEDSVTGDRILMEEEEMRRRVREKRSNE